MVLFKSEHELLCTNVGL